MSGSGLLPRKLTPEAHPRSEIPAVTHFENRHRSGVSLARQGSSAISKAVSMQPACGCGESGDAEELM
jgi:hypothetical protein